jgi:hypothetical protein
MCCDAEFVVAKILVKQQVFFSLLFFVSVAGFEIRGPGWKKIWIRDKHTGSGTLGIPPISQ